MLFDRISDNVVLYQFVKMVTSLINRFYAYLKYCLCSQHEYRLYLDHCTFVRVMYRYHICETVIKIERLSYTCYMLIQIFAKYWRDLILRICANAWHFKLVLSFTEKWTTCADRYNFYCLNVVSFDEQLVKQQKCLYLFWNFMLEGMLLDPAPGYFTLSHQTLTKNYVFVVLKWWIQTGFLIFLFQNTLLVDWHYTSPEF